MRRSPPSTWTGEPPRAPRTIAAAGAGCCDLAVRNRGQKTRGASFSDKTQDRESRKRPFPWWRRVWGSSAEEDRPLLGSVGPLASGEEWRLGADGRAGPFRSGGAPRDLK